MKIIQRLDIPSEVNSKEQLLAAIHNGARFVVFQYCVSVVALSMVRYSPAILILDTTRIEEKVSYYNRLSRFFGWWSIPYGISETLRSIRLNSSGGIDMTEDIMLNFNESMFATQELELVKTNQLFIKPNKDIISCFDRAMSDLVGVIDFKEVVIGLFINTEEYETPYLVIGINSAIELSQCDEVLSNALYKHFTSHTKFSFIDLNADSELSKRLLLQGHMKGSN
mgnify:CR=1 FL=1